MNNFDRVLVPISWKNEGKEVILKGNFPDFPKVKMQDVYSLNSKSEKSTLLWLPTGKYYYSFLVDGKEQIDLSKPTEIIKNKTYNVIKVVKETQKLEIINEANSQNSKEEIDNYNRKEKEIIINNNSAGYNFSLPSVKHSKIKSILDLSCTFSIKGENEVQELENSIMKTEEKDKKIAKDSEKVIVYNIGEEFLIPMIVIPLQYKDDNLIRLSYVNKAQDITLNKNDLFFQKTFSFDKCGNLSDLEIINELSVLRSMQLNFLERKNYICINNIFISFVLNEDLKVDDNSNYFLNQFLNIDNNEFKFYIIKKTSEIDFSLEEEKNKNVNIFSFPIMFKNINCYVLYQNFFNEIFTLLDRLNYTCFLQIIFPNSVNGNNNITFNLIPFFSPNTVGNFFVTQSLFFSNEESMKKFVKLNSIIEKEIQSISWNTNPTIHKNIISAIQNLCNFNAEMINLIYSLLEKVNLTIIFKDVFKLILLSYLIYNQKKYYTPISSSQVGNVILNNLRFYSNLILINVIKYIFDVISININKIKTENKEEVSFIYIFDSSPSEDNELLNEIILRKSSNNKLVQNNNVFSSFLLSNFKENITKHDNSLSNGDKKLMLYFENIISSSFFTKFYNESKKKFRDVLISNIAVSYQILQNAENKSESFKQIWYNNIDSYNNDFFSKDEIIIDFLQNNKILENSKNFHGKSFCELSIKNFFYHFLPILTDIDTSYNPSKNYSRQIKNFFHDLHVYQNIKEKFTIIEEKGILQIGYLTFEILVLLMKTIKIDKTIIIQKNIRMYSIKKMIIKLKKYTLIIQKKWRSYAYNKLINLDTELLSIHILNKYKKKDPILLKFIFDLKRNNQNLIFENQKLRRQINFLNLNKNRKCGINLMSNNFNLTNSNSLSISGRSFNHHYYQTTGGNNLTSRTNNINSSMSSNKSGNKSELNLAKNNNKKSSNEVKILKEKLESSKKKYKDLIVVASEYEKKMDVFIKLINSKNEIKDILAKNGVHFS